MCLLLAEFLAGGPSPPVAPVNSLPDFLLLPDIEASCFSWTFLVFSISLVMDLKLSIGPHTTIISYSLNGRYLIVIIGVIVGIIIGIIVSST